MSATMLGNESALLALPVEIIEHLLLFCHPRDVARFSTTCRFSAHIVYPLPIYFFDDPRRSIGPARLAIADPCSYDWKAQLTRRIKAEHDAWTDTVDPELQSTTLETFASTLEEASPIASTSTVPPDSRNLEWLTNVLSKSDILNSLSLSENQFRDRLNACLALPTKDRLDAQTRREQRNRSRCFVYDVRNYTADTLWGPYLPNGEVNWKHVHAIVDVVASNLRELSPEDHIARPPTGFEMTRAFSAPGDFSGRDWAGVLGFDMCASWIIVIYSVGLHSLEASLLIVPYPPHSAFNFSGTDDRPRDATFFTEGFREATHLIELKLRLVPKEHMRIKFPLDDPPTRVHPSYEVLYLCGSITSRGMSIGQDVTVQGYVFMGVDCIPRWRLTSVHEGRPQWCSEGVQIGNVGSAIGVASTWTAIDHGDGDPVGPTWFWKID
ncbi:F-box domain-containing protein [Favolaschia claudopus]|uniref:F-box domain-containing protein n=1 Tax=Favolaschia claudopus TaxID=2862362 RepID=A0AAW0ECH9_9AGAR